MKPTNVAEIQTAVEVLGRLCERLNLHAVHSIVRMPRTPIGIHYAHDIAAQTIEKDHNIRMLIQQLKIWEEELREGHGAKPMASGRFADPAVATGAAGMLGNRVWEAKEFDNGIAPLAHQGRYFRNTEEALRVA
jgi:hypothetical protein